MNEPAISIELPKESRTDLKATDGMKKIASPLSLYARTDRLERLTVAKIQSRRACVSCRNFANIQPSNIIHHRYGVGTLINLMHGNKGVLIAIVRDNQHQVVTGKCRQLNKQVRASRMAKLQQLWGTYNKCRA